MEKPKNWRFWIHDASDLLSVVSCVIILVHGYNYLHSRTEQVGTLGDRISVLEDRLTRLEREREELQLQVAIITERVAAQRSGHK